MPQYHFLRLFMMKWVGKRTALGDSHYWIVLLIKMMQRKAMVLLLTITAPPEALGPL